MTPQNTDGLSYRCTGTREDTFEIHNGGRLPLHAAAVHSDKCVKPSQKKRVMTQTYLILKRE